MDKSSVREQLVDIVGEKNYTDDELDILSYSCDMGALPKEILALYGFMRAEGIVLPHSTEEVAAIVELANKSGTPLTLRGGASTGYGGGVPVNGGIILDLTAMKNVIELNEKDRTVTVQCGITYKELLDFSLKRGYHPGIYPSSAYTATVGGFISMGGSAGIGAPKYGSIEKQVVGLKVVLANGETIDTENESLPGVELTNDPSKLFIGSEGIFGIITEAKLRIYPKGKVFVTCSVAFNDLGSALKATSETLNKKVVPHTLHLMDGNFLRNLEKAGTESPDAGAMILTAFEGPTTRAVNREKNAFIEICKNNGGKELGADVADREWAHRYKIELLFKKLGPTMIPLEVLSSVKEAPSIINSWKQTAKDKKVDLSIFIILGDDQKVLLMPMTLVDELDKGQFVKIVGIVIKMLEKSFNLGGKLYSVGVHNAPYAANKFGEQLEELRRTKASVDPNNILNPYKVVLPCIPAWLFKPAMGLLAALPSWLDAIVLKVAGHMPLNDFS